MIMFLIIWALTPTVFWPMIRRALRQFHREDQSHKDAELIRLAHRWIVWDWFRVSLIAIGFLASVHAISLPATVNVSNQAMQRTAAPPRCVAFR